ncbi:hypothetical protein BHE74_00039173 [Ensete ventricosum]|nr:hypothetical protein BHE74_00039173 [Ensete ventricosum]
MKDEVCMHLQCFAWRASGLYEKPLSSAGTVWTASAHIVAALIGSGVLALAWSVAQLGWIVGPLVLLGFSCVTYYTAVLLANCYSAVKRANCFHRNGHSARCDASGNTFMVVFGLFQLVLSQFPSLENITWLSVVAVATSFGYSFIGLGLCMGKWASHGEFRGTLAGTSDVAASDKAFDVLLALGNVAFAYTFADVLIEIQDTLKSPPPENKSMKRATFNGIGLTTVFYLLLGCVGYAAFGNDAPGNILTGFGFYEPFWLVDMANICVIVHLIGAYQVYAQPIFGRFENYLAFQWPDNKFIRRTYSVRLPFMEVGGSWSFTLSKLVLRTIFIMFTTLVAMLLPFFNAVLGLIGALGFWPLAVYFPVSMHIAQEKIQRGTLKWIVLQGLSFFCLLVSVAASIGSVADIVHNLKAAAPFKTVY